MHSKRRGLAKWFATATIAASVGAARADVVTVVIDNGTTYQTIEGFGATHLSLVYEGDGDYLGPEFRALAIDAVYHQVRLTTGNLAGGGLETPGGWNERSNDNSNPFNINWAGFSFFSADAIKTAVVDPAQPDFDRYYLESKINLRWASPWLADIRDTDYDT